MRGKKAKKLRRKIYGDDFSSRFRKYFRSNQTGQILTDERRRAYQKLKKGG